MLFVLSRTDKLFPPDIAPGVMQGLKAAGVDADYFLLDSEVRPFRVRPRRPEMGAAAEAVYGKPLSVATVMTGSSSIDANSLHGVPVPAIARKTRR